MEAGCSVTEVSLSVLGRAPRAIVVPWVEASIGGYALEKVLTQAQLARVEARGGPAVAAWCHTRWAWLPPTSWARSLRSRAGRVAC